MIRSRNRLAVRVATGIVMTGLILCVTSASALGAVRKVPQKYPTIQAAVDAANPGDVIEISKKRNFEHVTVNTPRLVIRGAKRGVFVDGYVEGSGSSRQFEIAADRVRIANIELRNGDGIQCTGDHCALKKVRFTGASGADCFRAIGDSAEVSDSRFASCVAFAVHITGNQARVVNSDVRSAGGACILIEGNDAAVRKSDVRRCAHGWAIGVVGSRALIRRNTVARAEEQLISVTGDNARISKNKGSASKRCVRVAGDRPRVQGNHLGPCGSGIEAAGAAPKVINNRFVAGDGHGVDVFCDGFCDGVQIERNVVRGQFNEGLGIRVTAFTGMGSPLVRANLVVGAASHAYYLPLDEARVVDNVARSSGLQQEAAFAVYGSGNLLRGNRAIGNMGDGFVVEGPENRFVSNEARKNHGDGFDVGAFGSANDTVLTRNVARDNSADGFENNGEDTILRRNRASGNRRDCANDGTIARKVKNRCADRSNFKLPGTASRVRPKRG
jgi:hypothetical protein